MNVFMTCSEGIRTHQRSVHKCVHEHVQKGLKQLKMEVRDLFMTCIGGKIHLKMEVRDLFRETFMKAIKRL